MRIIKTSMLREFWGSHRQAEASLRTWVQQTQAAEWSNFVQVRKTIPGADLVKVASGRSVVVFNIAHNRYRLIAAIHYNTRIVYTLKILTHKEYDRNAWKEQL
ncbi:MAG: type II toxin-antitoxin system HigB family toxin [Phycisphaerae bacterium]|jgi:mRNA interferase HigB|nr:type II toxin-antitoxin system HigB family toxin [Phycisphaerae bacterium]